jgi:hypothetical protein
MLIVWNGGNMRYFIDPPTGWAYGFPKEIDIKETRDEAWWLSNGYPQHLIDAGMLEYVRIISIPKDSEEINQLERF